MNKNNFVFDFTKLLESKVYEYFYDIFETTASNY